MAQSVCKTLIGPRQLKNIWKATKNVEIERLEASSKCRRFVDKQIKRHLCIFNLRLWLKVMWYAPAKFDSISIKGFAWLIFLVEGKLAINGLLGLNLKQKLQSEIRWHTTLRADNIRYFYLKSDNSKWGTVWKYILW